MVIEEHVLVFEKGGFVHCWSSIAQVFKMSPHTLLPESDGGLYVLWRGGGNLGWHALTVSYTTLATIHLAVSFSRAVSLSGSRYFGPLDLPPSCATLTVQKCYQPLAGAPS